MNRSRENNNMHYTCGGSMYFFHILGPLLLLPSSSTIPGDYRDNNIRRRSMNTYIRNRNCYSLECLTLGHTLRAWYAARVLILNGERRPERLTTDQDLNHRSTPPLLPCAIV